VSDNLQCQSTKVGITANEEQKAVPYTVIVWS